MYDTMTESPWPSVVEAYINENKPLLDSAADACPRVDGHSNISSMGATYLSAWQN